MEHKVVGDTNCSWCTRNDPQMLKASGGIGNRRTSGNHPDYSIVKIGQNSEKGPGNLRRLVVILTPMKDPQ